MIIWPKKEYLDRHNGLAQYVHHAICQSFDIQTCAKWHVHKPPEVIMLKNVEITYDSIISTDRPYVFNRPDIVVRDKEKKKCYIIDVSCPNDINVSQKEQEKITKYSGLRLELGRMHKETSPIGAMDNCARGLLHQRWCVSGLIALVILAFANILS